MKRRLLIITIFLLAGAVVNVAVAWGCAVTINVHTVKSKGARVMESMLVGVDRWSRPGAVLVTCYRVRREARIYRSRGNMDELLDDWTGFRIPTPEFQSGVRTSEERAANGRGWPMLTLWCETAIFNGGEVLGGLETGLPPFNTFNKSSFSGRAPSTSSLPGMKRATEPRVLPLRPIWLGLAVNTVIYATTLGLLVCGLLAVRRWMRVRRGLCPKCAYAMGESAVCTECGKALPHRAVA